MHQHSVIIINNLLLGTPWDINNRPAAVCKVIMVQSVIIKKKVI